MDGLYLRWTVSYAATSKWSNQGSHSIRQVIFAGLATVMTKMRSAKEKYHQPFLYDRKPGKNIEVYVMEWSELMEMNKRKLGYLSAKLKVKDKSVRSSFETEYPGIINEKVSARLTRTKVPPAGR